MDNSDLYHTDFTTASDQEILISKIEEIFLDWELPRFSKENYVGISDYNNGKWLCQNEPVNSRLSLTRYTLNCEDNHRVKLSIYQSQVLDDIIATENDFCKINIGSDPFKGPHPLTRWYGLRDFVVLSSSNQGSNISSESQIKTYISCLNIAVDNIDCSVPVFIQIDGAERFSYLGFSRTSKHQTDYEMPLLEAKPTYCENVAGLCHLFKSKIGGCTFKNPVTIAVRHTYGRTFWSPDDAELSTGGEWLCFTEMGRLPFGSSCNSISEILLTAVWPLILEQSVVDGDGYSDLDPRNAAMLHASVIPIENQTCLLSGHFTKFLKLSKLEDNPTRQVTGFRGVGRRTSSDSSIPNDVLMPLLYYLFPDADTNGAAPRYSLDSVDDPLRKLYESCLKGMKGAAYDSLAWRFAIVMAHIVNFLGGVRSAEQFWEEFIKELVFRCENNYTIPGLELGYPNPRTCLLNQKLQLLNCCIKKRVDRDRLARRPVDESESEPDEEFYDATEEVLEPEERKAIRHGPLQHPTGRLGKHGNFLLLSTGEPMYVPRTQDGPPRTEDQIEEHADILLQMGTDAAAAELRANLMSVSMLSDMEAFKAANPGAILADFIRWFSPRDWIEELDEFGQSKGELSSRMAIPGNTWIETWSVAKPVPARRQRRLFDDTKEMEKALMFLEVKTAKDFAISLLPVLTSCVLLQLKQESINVSIPGVSEAVDRLIKRAIKHSWQTEVNPDHFMELVSDIESIEKLITLYNSVYKQFIDGDSEIPELKTFVGELVVGDNLEVPGGSVSPIAEVITSLFLNRKNDDLRSTEKFNKHRSFPAPKEKELILRAETNKGPQRLYAVINKAGVRLAGAYTNFDN